MNILLVDDEPLIREHIEMCLVDVGHTVFQASTAEQAFTVMRSRDEVEFLITDFNLEPMSSGGYSSDHQVVDGVDVIDQFQTRHPNGNVLLISGNPELAKERLGNRAHCVCLSKPFRCNDLLGAVEKLCRPH